MRRYLLVALWPAGMAAIAAAAVIAARRGPAAAGPAAASDLAASGDGAEPAGTAAQAAPDGPRPGGVTRAGLNGAARPAQAAAGLPAVSARLSGLAAAGPDWMPDLLRLGAISCAGGALSYGVMALLGPTVVNRGPAIDEPIYRWTISHQVRPWAAIMERFGKVGNTWTTWGAAGTAAVCLGVSWRDQKWLPPSALVAAILVDHYATLALRRTFGRLGPPGSPGGTYPSGGCDRVVLLYGLTAHMLWREFSGSYRGKVWAIAAVAALSFNEAYSREYLSKHWFTDIISGLFYGGVLLAPFIAAVRLIAGPSGARGGPALAAASAPRPSVAAGRGPAPTRA
jgi:membrane-associated phospholipid phosphatase